MNNKELPPFQILWVEDQIEVFNAGRQLLDQDKDKLIGIPGRPISVYLSRTQKEADKAIAEAPPGGYDLILLDWKYPKDEGEPAEQLGPEWLPFLRSKQPLACITVLSSYAKDLNLSPAVAALRDDRADEVIPKGIDWDETAERIRRAIIHRLKENCLAQTLKPYLSKIARITMEDLQLAVGKARADLQASDVGFGDTARQASQILEGLAREVEKIGRRLPGKVKAELEDVDCMLLAKEESARHIGGQIPHPMPISAAENCVVRTYREEIQDALNEILQNAVDAVNELETFPSPPAVWINIRNTEIKDLGKCVEIAVSNKGNRFDEEARKNLYKPDNCHWTKDRSRHKGTGLYVASRMMMAVGGRLEVESSEEGSNVTLVVKDWS